MNVPFNADVERRVLAAILVRLDAAATLRRLAPELFVVPANREVAIALIAASGAGERISNSRVRAELIRRGRSDLLPFVRRLVRSAATPSDLDADVGRLHYLRRRRWFASLSRRPA